VEVSKMNRNGARRRMGRPVTRTWSTDFLLREGSSREEIGKWLKNKSIQWQKRRRLLQVVTDTFPCGQQMLKYGYKRTAECSLCEKVHEESGSSWNRELPKETIGHIQSEGCLGQNEVVTAAHNACIRELLQEADMHGKADRHMKLLTIETESRLGTLWDQEQCTQLCSKDELWEAAKEEEMKIPWKEANEGSPVSEEQYQERFFGLWSVRVHEHVTTRKTQRRIHAGDRRSGRRSSYGLYPARSYNSGRAGQDSHGWIDEVLSKWRLYPGAPRLSKS